MTATEIGAMLALRAEDTAAFLLPGGKRQGREWLAGSTGGEAGSSLKVILDGAKAGMWIDFAGADTDRGDLIGLWQRARGVDLSTACREALDWMQVPDSVRNQQRQSAPRAPEKPKAPDQRWIELQSVMRPGTYADLSALADLRHLSTAALQLATNHGQLFFAPVHDSGERHPAWILTDGSRRHAQARKMDGSLWNFNGSHKPAKSKTIWGTDSHWPVGLHEATLPEIALVEGAPDMLAAWQLIYEGGLTERRRPVAMFGSNTGISDDALPLFRDKTVFIFPHEDRAGESGASKWAAKLGEVCRVINRPIGAKDLNELIIAMQGEAS